jgi:YfiR/HmsC-like
MQQRTTDRSHASPILCQVVMRFGMGSAKRVTKSTGTGMTLGWRGSALVLLPLLLCAAAPPQRDVEKDTTAILQANYLYNIAKLVEWKDPSMRTGNFIIGVVGGANLYQELIKQYSTRTIGKQPIEVRKLPRTAEVDRCHMLFVGKNDLALLPEIYKRMRGKPTLLITEYSGALDDGSVVNFVKVDNLLKYELSMANATNHGLVVGLTLKNLAHRVEE